jgi:hypothetical protein
MKKIIACSFILAAVAVSMNSCCKDPGDGGDATVVVHLKHHGENVASTTTYPDSVFVKYDAEESPGTAASNYDKIFVGVAGEDHIRLVNLKCGKYYIFGTALDADNNERVFGGMAIKIKHKNRKKETGVDLAVSE